MPTAPTNFFPGIGLTPVYPDRARRQNVNIPASKTYRRGTVMGEQVGVNQSNTVTIAATAGTFKLLINGVATGTIAYNAAALAVQTALLAIAPAGANAVQTVTLATATGGTFTLAFGGEVTAPIAWNASAATVQTALQNLPTIGTGNATVSGSAGGPYTVTFGGILAGLPVSLLGANVALLTPGGSTVTVASVASGGEGGADVAVTGSNGGPYTIVFQNGLGNRAVTLTSDPALLTGGANTAVVASVTAGSAGTPGTFTAYAPGATDGSQVPKGVLELDVTTDASGNITFGWQSGGTRWGTTELAAPVFMTGDFNTADLIGLDAAGMAAAGWRLLNGTLASGIVRLP